MVDTESEWLTQDDVIKKGAEKLRNLYDNEYSLVQANHDISIMPYNEEREQAYADFMANSNLISTMLLLEAEGKVELSQEIKEKATQDVDRMLESIKMPRAAEVGELLLEITKAMRAKSNLSSKND